MSTAIRYIIQRKSDGKFFTEYVPRVKNLKPYPRREPWTESDADARIFKTKQAAEASRGWVETKPCPLCRPGITADRYAPIARKTDSNYIEHDRGGPTKAKASRHLYGGYVDMTEDERRYRILKVRMTIRETK